MKDRLNLYYMRSAFLLTILMLVAFVSCSDKQVKSQANKSSHKITMPISPAIMTDPKDIATYITTHFWDSADFADTTWITDTAAMEQAFVDWLNVVKELPLAKGSDVMTRFMVKIDTTPLLSRFNEIIERYLHDPNSPFRNEELYIPVLNHLIGSQSVDPLVKSRFEYQLNMALKNRKGSVANDFTYTLASGSSQKLHGVCSKYTLLFFYNPDCNACHGIMDYIGSSPVFERHISGTDGQLKVVAIYVDKDVDMWRSNLSKIPQRWIVGYDAKHELHEIGKYNLNAIPSLYLLDSTKRVILKDANVDEIENYLLTH